MKRTTEALNVALFHVVSLDKREDGFCVNL